MDLKDRANSLYYRLRHGPLGYPDPADPAQQHQLHLNVERMRVPETLFQPAALIGVDEAGLEEIVASVLRQVDPGLRVKMVQVRLDDVCGGVV